jgi:hypothetical protein
MSELINRYVHQVGLYVRPKERAEIEAELRSQIQDQIEGRYGSAPTQNDIAAVLKQLGDPRTMAVSYGGEQYLVGPELYPFMMSILRVGLPLVPTVVVVANIIGAITSPNAANWLELLVSSIFTAIQAALAFLGVVVILFAILQHSGEELRMATKTEFNPLDLPVVNEPYSVDRFESAFGMALGMLFGVAVLYYLQVGGLTLRFNLSDPGPVLPVPTNWLVVLLFTTFGSVFLNMWALIRRRWNLTTWLVQTMFNLVGAVAIYFAVLVPVAERLKQVQPQLGERLPLEQIPAFITLLTVILMIIADGGKLIRLWQHQQGAKT